MKTRVEEWDWPPPRRRGRHRTFDIEPVNHVPEIKHVRGASVIYQLRRRNSLGAKLFHAYWIVLWTILKILIAIPLAIITTGAFWLLWTIITL
jgi:hypothetical protein